MEDFPQQPEASAELPVVAEALPDVPPPPPIQPPPAPAPLAEEEEGGRMSFFEHLVELRKRIIHSAIAILIGMVIGLSVSEKVFGYLARPMLPLFTTRISKKN